MVAGRKSRSPGCASTANLIGGCCRAFGEGRSEASAKLWPGFNPQDPGCSSDEEIFSGGVAAAFGDAGPCSADGNYLRRSSSAWGETGRNNPAGYSAVDPCYVKAGADAAFVWI